MEMKSIDDDDSIIDVDKLVCPYLNIHRSNSFGFGLWDNLSYL